MSCPPVSNCPPPGGGVHPWIMGFANRCRFAGVSGIEAERLILERMTRPPSPADEVHVAVIKAYGGQPTTRQSPAPRSPRPIPLSELEFDAAKLKNFVRRISPPANWRHWLWERSAVRPDAQNALSFLAHLYACGETVLVFDTMSSKEPLQRVSICRPKDYRVPETIAKGGRYGRGIWFLCNPVDGLYHPNPRQNNELSCRSAESVTSFRYGVLESDKAPPDLWLSFIAQLPVPIAAIYSAGRRSIHTLVRIDARSKEEWDDYFVPLKRPLKVLGADPACLTAVRLTRLPQCRRPATGGFQKLLYVCPTPSPGPLFDLPLLHSRKDVLMRRNRDCPPWNSSEPFA